MEAVEVGVGEGGAGEEGAAGGVFGDFAGELVFACGFAAQDQGEGEGAAVIEEEEVAGG